MTEYENSIHDFVRDNYPYLEGKFHDIFVFALMLRMKKHGVAI